MPNAINEKPAPQNADTFEGSILKNVIREAWKEGLSSQKEKDPKGRMYELDEHALNMRRILSSYDYEIAGMPAVVANTSKMSREERRRYLSLLEAIAIGSVHLFSPDFANLIMLGVPRKVRDPHAASRYTSMLVKRLENRHNRYKNRIATEKASLQSASVKIAKHNSSILRFFRKRKITSLKRVIEIRSSRMRKLEARLDRYSYLLQKIKDKSQAAQ
ncbi:MAG: hypothetical protein QXF01_00900 [Candidatus Micrarchaeaceae archaeon]